MQLDEIEPWQRKGYLVLDVRTVPEFEDFHIDGALNIPLNQLAARVAEIGNLDTPILVHCAHGVRSFSAVGFLKVQGYENVIDAGGLE